MVVMQFNVQRLCDPFLHRKCASPLQPTCLSGVKFQVVRGGRLNDGPEKVPEIRCVLLGKQMAKRLCVAPEIKVYLLLVQVTLGSFKRSLAVVMGLVAVARELLVGQALTLARKVFGESVGVVLHKLA